ncbi:hypothetical protein M0811_01840 [Anaeramoeba ignava]|uniref:Uncharacterized protein n=1 Tax=Anaeramoeba ignava TaxID=1746090 RepID=A0A9Q0R9M5_ANAIG|nr:hypothetical protein M0811_01840 [Anaeramoeba ignava]
MGPESKKKFAQIARKFKKGKTNKSLKYSALPINDPDENPEKISKPKKNKKKSKNVEKQELNDSISDSSDDGIELNNFSIYPNLNEKQTSNPDLKQERGKSVSSDDSLDFEIDVKDKKKK